MFFKIILISCLFGIACAGVLFNSGSSHAGYDLGGYEGYGNDVYSSHNTYGGHVEGYGGQYGGAVSHVSITREISPSIPLTAHNKYGHSYASALGYAGAHGTASSYGLGNGYGLAYDNGYNNAHGYKPATSTVSQYSIHASPLTKSYRSYVPSTYSSYPYSYSSYGSKAW